MKVLIFTHGSRGDVDPFITLAYKLEAVGHNVFLCAPESSRKFLGSFRGCFFGFDDSPGMWMTEPGVLDAIASNYRGVDGKKVFINLIPKVRALAGAVFDEMAHVTRCIVLEYDCCPDIVIHHADLPGNEIAEFLDVPSVAVCLQPSWIPTKSFQNPAVPFRMPSILNRFSYSWSQWRLRLFTGSASKWRKEVLSLPHRRGHRNFLYSPDGAPKPVIQGFSKYILPGNLDYPDWVSTVGFIQKDGRSGWEPPNELVNFISDGDVPIFIGFGSMVGSDPGRTGRMIVEAVRLSGMRAVVAAGWGGMRASDEFPELFYVDEVPYGWLFPRMAAIVHHGGSGTTGLALKSGCPQVVCPALYDQKFFAERLHMEGIAPAPMLQTELYPAGLASRIRRAVNDSGCRDSARHMGGLVRSENGPARAVKVLESMAS